MLKTPRSYPMRVMTAHSGRWLGSAAAGELSLGCERRRAAKSMADEASISTTAGAYSQCLLSVTPQNPV